MTAVDTQGGPASASLREFFRAAAPKEQEGPGDMESGRRYYERPVRVAERQRKPKFVVVGRDKKEKEVEPEACGHQSYRFSRTGTVEVLRLQTRKQHRFTEREQEERKAAKLPERKLEMREIVEWWVIDPTDGRKTALTGEIKARLTLADISIPGFGWQSLAAPSPADRIEERTCSRCQVPCLYKGGDAPVVGGRRPEDALLPNEWAEMRIERKSPPSGLAAWLIEAGGTLAGSEAAYTLCASCVPAKFTYCDHCRAVHRAWHTAPVLAPLDPLLRLWRAGSLPQALYVRSYPTGGKDRVTGDPAWIHKPEHASDRIAELVTYVGRASVCASPSPYYAENLGHYLSELRLLQEWAHEN